VPISGSSGKKPFIRIDKADSMARTWITHHCHNLYVVMDRTSPSPSGSDCGSDTWQWMPSFEADSDEKTLA
jgi:hypothetical protein